MTTVLISIFCPDRTGLVAAIAGRLFDLGADLGDTSFAVLGTGAEFTTICELPDGTAPAEIEADLKRLPALAEANVTVRPFRLDPVHGRSGQVTHRVSVSGADRPGLIAGLCETFVEYRANIVRLNSERVPGPRGGQFQYVVHVAVSIPPESAAACLATVSNTAQGLQLTCHWEKA